MSIVRRRVSWLAGLVLMLVAGCASSDLPPPGSTAAGPPTTSSQDLNGAHVEVVGLWSGPELDSFRTVAQAWERETGGTVDWEGTQDLSGVVADRVRAGDTLPGIAILPNVALMNEFAEDGLLIPLDSVVDMGQILDDYPPAWIDLGSHDGTLYGIFYKLTNKAVVWYSPKAFAAAGYQVPTTWQDMITLADTMVADSRTPFSVLAASGPASGWALTDWISEIVLNNCGPARYDRWVAADIPWTDPCIKQSFDLFIQIVATPGYVLGGPDRILATGDDHGADPLYTSPPAAYMCYLASFAQAFIASSFPNLEPGSDYSVFTFPTINPGTQRAVTIGADVPVMMSDSPAARSFMTYLAGARAQEMWIERGGFISVNRSVPMDSYPDPVARAVAADLTAAEVSRFSAGDMLPASVQRAWWAGMLAVAKDPTAVDSVLNQLTALAESER